VSILNKPVRVDPNMQPAMRPWLPITRCPLIFRRRAIPKAKEYALKAWNSTMGWLKRILRWPALKFYGDWDWTGAEKEFKRALGLNPNDAETHRTYSSYLLSLARFDELSSRSSAPSGWTRCPFTPASTRVGHLLCSAVRPRSRAVSAGAGAGRQLRPVHMPVLGQSYRAKGMREQAISESSGPSAFPAVCPLGCGIGSDLC